MQDELETVMTELPARGSMALVDALAHVVRRMPPARVGPKRRRVAVIAWFFPPAFSAGVRRPAALANSAARRGWDVDVIAAPAPVSPAPAGVELSGRIPSTVRVHRVQPPRAFLELPPAFEVDGGLAQALTAASVTRYALHESPPDVVVASGPPFSSFVAGRYLAKMFGARLVLDYRDEWTECPFDWVAKHPADRMWERRCLAEADGVVFTTSSALEHQLETFPMLDRARCYCIPNGWDPEDFALLTRGAQHDPSDGPVTLSYVGTLASHSLPGPFLDPISAVLERRPDLRGRIRLRLLGKVTPPAEEQLARFPYPALVERTGVVPTPQAARFIEESSALLQPNTADLARYRPLKLYDYIASERPILVFGDGGEIAGLVRELDAGWVVPEGQSQVLEGALDEIIAHRNIPRPAPSRSSWLAAHTRKAMAERFLDVFDGLIDQRRDVR